MTNKRFHALVTPHLSGPRAPICEVGIMKPHVGSLRGSNKIPRTAASTTHGPGAVTTAVNELANVYRATHIHVPGPAPHAEDAEEGTTDSVGPVPLLLSGAWGQARE